MSNGWSETLQGAVKTIVCCGGIGFVVWVATSCFLKIMRWYRDERKI